MDNSQKNVRKKINIKYLDFWPYFKYEDFEIQKILEERYEVVITQKPDYIIYSEYGGRNYGFEQKFDCIKIAYQPENSDPEWDNTDYSIGMHYLKNGDRYFRKPTETEQLSAMYSIYNLTKVKGINNKKKKFCAWVVSNDEFEVRNRFFEKLSLYKKVDSGGRYKNNVGGPVKDKIQFLTKYKFSICFENSKTPGYISEKLYEAFEAGTIPIYYGDDTVLRYLNNRSYIHIKDEKEFDEKIELIKKIDQNYTLYQQMIREKIVIDDSRYQKDFQKYKKFIYHIFDQDKRKAKRFKRKK